MIKYLSEMGPFFTDNETVSTSTAKIKPSISFRRVILIQTQHKYLKFKE